MMMIKCYKMGQQPFSVSSSKTVVIASCNILTGFEDLT
jgi:hypothetical protein